MSQTNLIGPDGFGKRFLGSTGDVLAEVRLPQEDEVVAAAGSDQRPICSRKKYSFKFKRYGAK